MTKGRGSGAKKLKKHLRCHWGGGELHKVSKVPQSMRRCKCTKKKIVGLEREKTS